MPTRKTQPDTQKYMVEGGRPFKQTLDGLEQRYGRDLDC